MTDERLTRRRILASIGTAGSAGIAGCTFGDSNETLTGTIHVSTDGSNDNPGTEEEPLSSIQAAIDSVEPGQTVNVHPGEYVEAFGFETAGEPDAPITLTGPREAVLRPPEDWEHQAVSVNVSYIHITGLTITGLHNSDEPEQPDSYHPGKLIGLNENPDDGDD